MNRKQARRRGMARGGLGLLAVQSILCAVILVIAVILRLIGGNVYEQLRDAFRNAMQDDSLATALTDELAPPEGQGGADLHPGTASVLSVPNGVTLSPLSVFASPHRLLSGGKKTSDFGYRTDPIDGGTGFHTGVDIAAVKGTPLYAVLSGTVIRAGWHNSYGRYVVIECENDMQLWYAHCSALLVKKGDTVRAGDTIAKVGSTGDSTGPHVHFMVRVNGVAHNPNPLITADTYA